MSRRNEYTIETPLASNSYAVNTTSDPIDIRGWDGYSIVARYTASAPDPSVIASTGYLHATNLVTDTNHGFKTGLLGALSTDDALPTGLSATNYHIIAINANAYRFAANVVAAEAGTFVPFSTSGTGNHTFTPAAANVSIQLQGSLDNSTFITIDSENVTTDSSNVLWNVDQPHYLYARVQYIVISGQGTFQVNSNKEAS